MELRKIDSRDCVKVVTSNSFITCPELAKLSLKARKILYIIIAQARKDDEEFYSYSITAVELAELLGVRRNHLYESADRITDELMRTYIKVLPQGKKRFKKYSLFSMCEYSDGVLYFKLDKNMSDFFIGLKKSFTQTLLADYLSMSSVYTMSVWHLFQREMRGRKPATRRICFYVSLDELRIVTGTADMVCYDKLSNFKSRVLDKAIEDIKNCCGTHITYSNHKEGHTVVGFDFVAINEWGIDLTDFVPNEDTIARIENFKKKQRT